MPCPSAKHCACCYCVEDIWLLPHFILYNPFTHNRIISSWLPASFWVIDRLSEVPLSRASFRLLALIIAIALSPVYASGNSENGTIEYLEPDARMLHVIVFESSDISDQLPKDQHKVFALTGADLPLRLSRAFFTLSSSARFSASELMMRGDVSLLDVNTFSFSEKQIKKSKQVKRHNALAGLTYSLTVLDWSEAFCSVRFSARSSRSRSPVIAQLSRSTTTILRLDRLCFAFTFIKAAMETDEIMRNVRIPNSKLNYTRPKPIKTPLPEYPAELRARGIQGKFFVMALFTEQGAIDPSHGIILECLHWLFARNALEVILKDWEFMPGKVNDRPADMIALIEVSYKLY